MSLRAQAAKQSPVKWMLPQEGYFRLAGILLFSAASTAGRPALPSAQREEHKT